MGTATMLLRLGPFTLLTDPNFLHRGQRAYLGYGLASKRRTDPALAVHQLPALDGIVLSHMHGDHWDRVARRALDRSTPVITTRSAARALARQGFRNTQGLGTWGETALHSSGHALRIIAVPGRHATGVARHLLPPVMGSVLEYQPAPGKLALRMYITGDTLLVDELRAIPQRYPHLDVAVLHLGGTTLPGGLVVTMDGAAGAELVQLLAPTRAVPIHYDDYRVFRSPLSHFEAEIARRGLSDIVDVVRRGDIRALPCRRVAS
jgi:L-ascorbate metabolism protein UlaG (beta-lactamase superfamily)